MFPKKSPTSYNAKPSKNRPHHDNDHDERGMRIIYPENGYTNTILGLDSLAKLFCTGEYSAIIKPNINNNTLYISLPEGKFNEILHHTINQSNINLLKNFLNNIKLFCNI